VVEGTGGLRKVRFGDSRRAKGKRGGLRMIHYHWTGGPEFWLFTLMTSTRWLICRQSSERC
jgi:hypothetical protein